MTDTAELIARLLNYAEHGFASDHKTDCVAAADALSSLVSERDELRGEVYVPGEFCCAKCGFMLSQFTISANTGAIGSRDHPGERCPNDGAPLWRVTWKQRAEQHYERAAEEMSRATAAEAGRDEALEAAYDQPHGPTSRILWSTRYRELLDDYKDTEQVVRLTRERDDALATISLLQSQHRKQQEHDTAIIEGLTRDVNRYALDGPFSHIIEPSGIDRRASEASLLSNTSEVGKDE